MRSQLDSESVNHIIFMNTVLQRRFAEDKVSKESTEVPEQLPTIKQEPIQETSEVAEVGNPPLPALYQTYGEWGTGQGMHDKDWRAKVPRRGNPKQQHHYYNNLNLD